MCVMFHIVGEKEKTGGFKTWLSGNQKTLRLKPLSLKQTALPTYVSCVLRVFVIIYTKKLLNSDCLRKECSSSVTRVQNL